MQALESLEHDHRLLRSLTEALEAYVSALEAGHPLHAGDLRDLVQGFRTVADYRHFEKVEEVLVPVLVRNGFDYNLDVLDGGRLEHERVRYLIEVLYQSAERELSWNLDERQRIACAARNLVEHQRRLTTQLEQELFPEIVTRLDGPVLGRLTEQLCQFDEQSAARDSALDIPELSRSVLARYAATVAGSAGLPPTRDLPSAREIAR
jgi:hemerythrin-like domain-containing protein